MNKSILDGLEGGHPQNTAPSGSEPTIFCGDIDMRIARDGTWYYKGSPIARQSMIKLFASVLTRSESGEFWLKTPVEKCRIRVEDAPFVAVEMESSGFGDAQLLRFRTNVDDFVIAGPDHPIRLEIDSDTAEPSPYIMVREGLDALIVRAVFYDLVELGVEERRNGETVFGIWSGGVFFPLGDTGENED